MVWLHNLNLKPSPCRLQSKLIARQSRLLPTVDVAFPPTSIPDLTFCDKRVYLFFLIVLIKKLTIIVSRLLSNNINNSYRKNHLQAIVSYVHF